MIFKLFFQIYKDRVYGFVNYWDFLLPFALLNTYLFLFVAGEKKEADTSTSKDSEAEKPDKDSSNL